MSLTSPNILLLSIHQKYVNKIFCGDKTVELRRVKPRYLQEGDLILVYATSPEKALVGVIEVEKVIEMDLDKLWKSVKSHAGINYQEFQEYYNNLSSGCAIFLKQPHSFNHPIKLEMLQQKWSQFRPPQSYRYLKEQEVKVVSEMTHYDILAFSEKQKHYQTELLF